MQEVRLSVEILAGSSEINAGAG